MISPATVEGKPKFEIPGYFVFGDSLGDVGTNTYLPNATDQANILPRGETYFHKPRGRFTNDRNIVDFLDKCCVTRCQTVFQAQVLGKFYTGRNLQKFLIVRFVEYSSKIGTPICTAVLAAECCLFTRN